MKPRALLQLARQNLRADLRGAVINALATSLGVAALLFFIALGIGVSDASRHMFPGDARIVEVVPAAVSLGSILGGGKLDRDAVTRLKSIAGVERAWPKLQLRVAIAATRPPEKLTIGWPSGLAVQIPAVGIDPEMVAADVGAEVAFRDRGPAEPIPVVASKRLLEIYNKSLAPSWNMPKLPAGLSLVGAQLFVIVGKSFVAGGTEPTLAHHRLELAGMTDRVPMHQLGMPLESVERLHRDFNKPDLGYSSVVVLAARPDDVPAIAGAVRRMGFSVDEGERAMAERIGAVVKVTTGSLALLGLLMCGLAAISIAQSLGASVRARSREIAILRALGATAGDVGALVLTEAAIVGAVGGAIGIAAARLAAWGGDRLAAAQLPDFPFKPATFFAFEPSLYAIAFGIALLAAVIGALAPARAAARLDPARAIA